MLRMRLARVATAATISVATFLGVATASATPALAYNCGSWYLNHQKDAFATYVTNYSLHHWHGVCAHFGIDDGWAYAGTDSHWPSGVTHNVDGISIRLRAWDCGTNVYDLTRYAYSTWHLSFQTQDYVSVCGVNSDSNVNMWVNGQWSWWNYLNY